MVITTYFVIDRNISLLLSFLYEIYWIIAFPLWNFNKISSLFFSIGSENNTSNFGISREFGNENLVKRIVKWLLDFYSYLNSIYYIIIIHSNIIETDKHIE